MEITTRSELSHFRENNKEVTLVNLDAIRCGFKGNVANAGGWVCRFAALYC